MITSLFLGTDREGISLGNNCRSASYGVEANIRSKKIDGYKTCPFDEMISNYNGIINCINNDFDFFFDVELKKNKNKFYNTLIQNQNVIYNKKYNFVFLHESPCFDFYITQNWKNGINHYIMDNFKEFNNRYKRRIQNFKDLITSGKKIDFILQRSFINGENDISLLYKTIRTKYPHLEFKVILLDIDKYAMYNYLTALKIDENDNEIKRLFIEESYANYGIISKNVENNKIPENKISIYNKPTKRVFKKMIFM
jgi:hypothetical protein